MKKILLLVGLLCLSFIFVGCQSSPLVDNEAVQLANPASTYCIKQGGVLTLHDTVNGSYGLCTFDDGSMCEEWAYFRGECVVGKFFVDLHQCDSYFDGCNTCIIEDGNIVGCSRKYCPDETVEETRCIVEE